MKSSVIYVFAFLIIVFLFFSLKNTFSCRRLSCIFVSGIKDFTVKDIYDDRDKSYRALYANGSNLLRVEKMFQPDQFAADQYVAADIARVKGLFTDSLAPYPGVASNTVTCENKYQPIFNKIITIEKLEISYFVAYLNSNLTYGSCTEAQVTNKGISAYFYCSKNKLAYHLEIISPVKDFESSSTEFQKMTESIKCK